MQKFGENSLPRIFVVDLDCFVIRCVCKYGKEWRLILTQKLFMPSTVRKSFGVLLNLNISETRARKKYV